MLFTRRREVKVSKFLIDLIDLISKQIPIPNLGISHWCLFRSIRIIRN